jgi:hypothetical protein
MRVALVVIFVAFLVLPPAVILVMAFIALLRAEDYDLAGRRRARGECVACGYDLRGGGETCPECVTGRGVGYKV